MQKKGMRPSIQNYELLLLSYAEQAPTQWEKAISLFDKINTKRFLKPTAKTYNALMRVYLGMKPFDWRVVYNCYYELRHHKPRIALEWESYELLREALLKGQAGYFRRTISFLDAWITITPPFCWEWMKGLLIFTSGFYLFKTVLAGILSFFFKADTDENKEKTCVL